MGSKIDYPYAVGIGNVTDAGYVAIQFDNLEKAMTHADKWANSRPGVSVFVYAAVFEFTKPNPSVTMKTITAVDRDA